MNETLETGLGENRLKQEKSPYLLQHAENPIHWYPWRPEAFHAAITGDKPIFLSIGYSTCHWCHVMGRESFEDPAVAQALNRSFIAIKVDREERPDVDAVYMAACQALTGSGGWPLTILMTPDQKPFWAGTYLPPRGCWSWASVSPGTSPSRRASALPSRGKPCSGRLQQSCVAALTRRTAALAVRPNSLPPTSCSSCWSTPGRRGTGRPWRWRRPP